MNRGTDIVFAFFAFILGMFIGGLIVDSRIPKRQLDVYRGKTTLEITYRDSVAIDSTVVYKVK